MAGKSGDIRSFFGQGQTVREEERDATKQVEKRRLQQKTYDTTKRKRSVQDSWLEEFPWAEIKDNKLICTVCTQFPTLADTKSSLFKDDNSVKPKDYTFPVVLVPTLKCEALHQDYFQVKEKTKVPADTEGHDPNPQHVTVQHSSFTPPQSSNPPTKQSQDSSEHFLSHDRSHDQSPDLIPHSSYNSADKNIKSTSLSDLCRLSPHYDDYNFDQGLTQSCHEYYNTQKTSLSDTPKSLDIKHPHTLGGSLNILSNNSELISCTKSTTQIQQAKKRCIPKVGIRTIPLIKIKPECKSLGLKNDKTELISESKSIKPEIDICKEPETNGNNKGISNDENNKHSIENNELNKAIVDEKEIVGEVIVHEPYRSEGISPVSVEVDTFSHLEASKRELSTIIEENKAINESSSENSLQTSKPADLNVLNEIDNTVEKNLVEPWSAISTPDIQWTPRLRDKLGIRKGSLFDDSETANTNDSLFVNKDEDSLNTVTDIQEEEFCTQFSDSEEEIDCVNNNCEEDKDKSTESDSSEYDYVSEELDDNTNGVGGKNNEAIKQSNSAIDGIIESERLERQLKARTCLSLGRDIKPGFYSAAENLRSAELKHIQSDSEGTLYYSFNSLDSVKLNESCGALSKGSRRLPLKWTPRVLLESRISSLTSGTFSEASFHTADTFGTFYSARSFQLDSCDNFQTCEDFTKYEEIPETKSKLSKAKDALIRGKDFVKAKFEDYCKRIPNIRRLNLGEHSACQRTCGFSCVHVGKEISQYSLPETFGLKGGNSERGDYSSDLEGDNCDGLSGDIVEQNGDDKSSELRMGKEGGTNGERDQKTINGEQKKGSKRSNNNDIKENQNGAGTRRTVRMDLGPRDATEDDLPVGSEALSIPRSKKLSENGDSNGKPVSKRLRWVSAVEKTQGTSLSSSFASNSSVEQLLCQRQMDPESMLRNLGFDGGPNTDESANRIPDRFLLNPCTAKGIDLQQFVLTHPEIQHLVPDQPQHFHVRGASPVFPLDEVDCAVESSTPIKGNMQQHHFSSLLQGVRFLHHTQSLGNVHSHSPTYQVPDEETKRISSIPSVLDFPNRRFLAKQGFYGTEFTAGSKKQKPGESLKQTPSISADERRKQFQHAGRSKNWSLTEDSETDNSENSEKSEPHKDSFDQGLMLRSFSERFSSESSLESSDSFGDKRDELRRQSSISYLRKQYQETIRNSIDTTDKDIPVFDPELETFGIESVDMGETVKKEKKKLSKQSSISDIRKAEVERLMSAEEDDGDYFAHSLKTSWKEPLRKLGHHSTQSTLTDSPKTPKEFSYSFDKSLQDGETEFNFPTEGNNGTSKEWIDQSPAVSIVIEDDPSEERQVIQESFSSVQYNPNELAPLNLIRRTDSSNTIVQGEYLSDMEHSEGEVTPQPGDISPGLILQAPDFIDNKLIHVDALSESTSSSETWTTVLPTDTDLEVKIKSEKMEVKHDIVNKDSKQEVKGQRSPDVVKDFLKPDIARPQESFELEEISSADNVFEDINGNTTKSQSKLGQLEKSLSTHSDSSGFADIDQGAEMPGEATPYIPKSLKGKRSLTKQSTFGKHNDHDLPSLHDNQSSIQSQSPLHQTENRERKMMGPVSATVNQNNIETFANEFRHEKIHVCGKAKSKEDLENENPSLQSISYIPCDKANSDKSVVYSISVPMTTHSSKSEPVGKFRFLSSVKFEIGSESSVDNESVKSLNITQAGPVLHQKILTDLELGEGHEQIIEDLNNNDNKAKLTDLGDEITDSNGITSMPKTFDTFVTDDNLEIYGKSEVHRNMQWLPQGDTSTKQHVLKKKRSKEALITSSHTADWLLRNERQSGSKKREIAKTLSQSRVGKPIWASTPNLNMSVLEKERNMKGYRSKHIGKSLDIVDDEMEEENERFRLMSRQQTSLSQQTSLNDSATEIYIQPSSSQNLDRQITEISRDIQNYAQEMRHDILLSPAHESVPLDSSSYIGSSTGMPEEQVQYIKLAKLVNGPSQIVGPHIKMPIVKFKPNIHMKDWTLLPKQQHLEEETRLMQHAVQRYKIELLAMETMLFNMRQVAEQSLNREERLEVEELQHLWSEVRKEVNKMEELLSVRLSAVLNGNINYNPLDAVEIVHAMIELLREQLYHQQMCIERETHIDILEEQEIDRQSHRKSSNRSSSLFEPCLSDLSQQMSDIKLSVSKSQQNQKEEFRKSLSELKDSILSEVREEVSSTQNIKMLQLQVQAREHEIKRLKLELLQQNIETGKTRKRQTFESDV